MSVQFIVVVFVTMGGVIASIIPAEIWLRIWLVDPAPLSDAPASVIIWLHFIQGIFGGVAGCFAALIWMAAFVTVDEE